MDKYLTTTLVDKKNKRLYAGNATGDLLILSL
jgi:hypothetical protein